MVGVTTGINTGIEIGSIVSAMVAAEKAPKQNQLARLQTAAESKFSALGTLKGALSELQTALKELKDPKLYEKRTATSSKTEALTATATSSAAGGTYKISIDRLATSSKVATGSISKDFTAAGAGSLTVKLGASDAGVAVDIAEGDSLSAVRDKLNIALKDKGITANVINNPADDTSRLVLSAKESGDGNDIYIESDSPALASLKIGAIDYSDPDKPVGNLAAVSGGSAGYLVQAQNALFSVDGLALSSAKNSVSDVIPDVTLSLSQKTEPEKPLTLTIDQDRGGVKSTVKKFVDTYNKLISTTRSLTNVTSVGDDKAPVTGALVGDSSVRNLLSAVQGELTDSNGEAGGFRSLAELGITTQKDGKLQIDDTKLNQVLESDYAGVGNFLSGDNGLMNRLNGKVDVYLRTGGLLQQRMDGLQTTRSDITKQQENLDRRMTEMQTRLYKQFVAMDSLVGQMRNTSNGLLSALANLPGVSSKK